VTDPPGYRPSRLASLRPVSVPVPPSEPTGPAAEGSVATAPGPGDPAGADRPTRRRRRRPSAGRIIGWALVAVASWLALSVLNPGHDWGVRIDWWGALPYPSFSGLRFGDLFANTTANGGDMGAHVWWPRFLEQHWLGKGRLSGWAPDWYAGFPVGQYYFPVPAVLIALLDHVPFVPYNVAFKLVTVSGPVLLPVAAWSFARGLRAPWPAPPAFAIAALGTLMQTRSDWQIYGGNIASTLAGEFSFTLALALALFGLGALGVTLETGRRRWLPAALIAAALLSHIVVGIFIALAATLMWLTRRPLRTWPLAVAIGGTAGLLTAVWTVPLLANQAYTQSMRYTKVLPGGGFSLPSWMPLPGPVRNTVEQLVRALGEQRAADGTSGTQLLWLPWWVWGLGAVAVVAAGWYRRRPTALLVALAAILGVLFVQWPEHAIWNTRFLPFWVLTWAFLAAMGATEIARMVAALVGLALRWVRDGDLQDERARAWTEIATAPDGTVDEAVRRDAVRAIAARDFDSDPPGWTPPDRLAPARTARDARRLVSAAMSAMLLLGGGFALVRAWEARNGNPEVAITGWAAWNYSGYERKAAWPQYRAVLEGMDDLSRERGPGRALWEPSSGTPDAINSYGTSLALELLPYFTEGRIGSMEGIYFESSATTSYHFLTVAECAKYPSNPVRGLEYGSLSADFDLCVRHLRDLGVRYYMAWTDEAIAKADKASGLKLVKEIAQEPPISGPSGSSLSRWRVYEVAGSDLVVGMDREPVVAAVRGGTTSECFGTDPPAAGAPEPELHAWECAVAPWWTDRERLDVPFAQSGPDEWRRVAVADLGSVVPRPIDPVEVTEVRRSVDEISFRVSEPGRPVLIRESYYPNWEAHGARGPYRIAPNLMVVIPTAERVSLTYGLTAADWIGRVLSLLGVVGLVGLARWKGGARFAAGAPPTGPVPEPSTDVDPGVSGPPTSGDPGGSGPPLR